MVCYGIFWSGQFWFLQLASDAIPLALLISAIGKNTKLTNTTTAICFQSVHELVCYTAVFSDALCDDSKNGCLADYARTNNLTVISPYYQKKALTRNCF